MPIQIKQEQRQSAATAIDKIKQQTELVRPTLSIQDLIEKSAKELGRALPSHMNPERIVRIALTTLRMNPQLYKCDPYSFLGALFQAAQLGLEPNIQGECYIIPYLVKGRLMAQFQIGAYGLVKLFWNHQQSVSLQMETVRENDEFTYDLGNNELSHKPAPFGKERGEAIGYYAVAHMAGAGRAIKVLSKEEALKFGKRFSKCWDKQTEQFKDYTPWREHFDAIDRKTVLKQLMKLLPKSIEIQRALSMDETVKTKIEADMVVVPNEDDFKPEATEAEIIEPGEEEQKEIKERELKLSGDKK